MSGKLSHFCRFPGSAVNSCTFHACALLHRYYICDKKLLALGWAEKETWEAGLRETVEWYLKNGFATYWENGNVEAALTAHPTLAASSGAPAA